LVVENALHLAVQLLAFKALSALFCVSKNKETLLHFTHLRFVESESTKSDGGFEGYLIGWWRAASR
jgi:hypothetical protein